MRYTEVKTAATVRAEQAGRVLIADWVREGRSPREIGQILRMGRSTAVIYRIVAEVRADLESIGWQPPAPPVDLDALQDAS